MKKVLFLIIITVLVTGTIPVRKRLQQYCGPDWKQENLTYVPGNENIKHALLGFETTLAHYLWIRTILYFGSHKTGDNTYPWIITMLDIITRLCPWFYPAYEFAGLMVPDICGNPEAARILLERGITNIGERNWKCAFYLGMLYYKYYDDRRLAAESVARAAQVKSDQQKNLFSLADVLYTQSGSPQESLALMQLSYSTSENPEVRAFLAEKIDSLKLVLR